LHTDSRTENSSNGVTSLPIQHVAYHNALRAFFCLGR